MINPVQDILDRMTFKPFWWFSSWAGISTIQLIGHHMTVSSTKEFDPERCLTMLKNIAQHEVEVTPKGVNGVLKLHSDQENAPIFEIARDIEAGWIVFSVDLKLGREYWDTAGVATGIRQIMSGIAVHEFEEFTRFDGERVVDPHPGGGNTFKVADITEKIKLDYPRKRRFPGSKRGSTDTLMHAEQGL